MFLLLLQQEQSPSTRQPLAQRVFSHTARAPPAATTAACQLLLLLLKQQQHSLNITKPHTLTAVSSNCSVTRLPSAASTAPCLLLQQPEQLLTARQPRAKRVLCGTVRGPLAATTASSELQLLLLILLKHQQ
jgi:hypothetical protein